MGQAAEKAGQAIKEAGEKLQERGNQKRRNDIRLRNCSTGLALS
jgi:hypothetical protein